MKTICILVVMVACFGCTQAKFCYSCTGYPGSSCDQEVFYREDPRVGKIECPRFCVKQFTKDEFNRPITVRGCGGDGCVDECNGGECTYCCQMHDLCNSAGVVASSLVLLTGAAILVRLL